MKTQYLLVAFVILSFSVLLAQETKEKISTKSSKTTSTKVAKQSIDNTYAVDKINSTSAVATYDFTTSASKYYGGAAGAAILEIVGLDTTWGMVAGDVNGDGIVKYNLANNDRALILQKIGGTNVNATVTGYHNEDVNMDGIVKYNLSNNDRAVILQSIGGTNVNATKVTQVP